MAKGPEKPLSEGEIKKPTEAPEAAREVPATSEHLAELGSQWETRIGETADAARAEAEKEFEEAPARIGVAPEKVAEAAAAVGVPKGRAIAEQNLDAAATKARTEIGAAARPEAAKAPEAPLPVERIIKTKLIELRARLIKAGSAEEKDVLSEKIEDLENEEHNVEYFNKQIRQFEQLRAMHQVQEQFKAQKEKAFGPYRAGERGIELTPVQSVLDEIQRQMDQLGIEEAHALAEPLEKNILNMENSLDTKLKVRDPAPRELLEIEKLRQKIGEVEDQVWQLRPRNIQTGSEKRLEFITKQLDGLEESKTRLESRVAAVEL